MAEENSAASRTTGSGPAPKKKKRRRRKRHNPITIILKILGTILLVGVTTGVILVCFATVYINKVIIPEARNFDYLGEVDLSLTSTMYYTDEQGVTREYLTISSDENRDWVDYAHIPENLLRATVATEDKRFYDHHGVDWIRTANGVLRMFTGQNIQGGSTLTQQLIKNITGEDQTTVKRKILEIFRALEFDKSYSKETTLEWYLNYIYFGERCYGIQTASYMYFGKDVSKLDLAECACLISIPNNPSRYDPYLNKNAEVTNDQALRKRAKDVVLWSMKDQGMITEEEYEAARKKVDRIVFTQGSQETTVNTTVYNWYQDQVIDDVIKDLMEKYDWSSKVAANKVYYGGLSIYANVDPRIQEIVESVYSDPENLPYVSNSGQPMQSGITVVDHNGRVVAVAGGIGEKTINRAWSRASDTVRPPGSSIKPLAVYGPALEMGLITPYSVVDDSPYQEMNGKPWPVNAYGYYRGLTDLPYALAVSSNTVATRILGDMVTVDASYAFLQNRFHITSLVEELWIGDLKFSDRDLAPLAMGGMTAGVSTYEMAAAYASFPSLGRYVPPTTYSKVVDPDGVVLLDTTDNGEYILKETTAYYMNTLLQNVVTSPYGTATKAKLEGMPVAGKTGTTTSEKDLWFVGYTPYYTAAVWTGYDRQEQMKNVGLPTVDLWKKVMSQIHEGLEYKEFDTPSGVELVTASYCLDSGMKPGEFCSVDVRGNRVATGVYVKGDEPKRTCTMHVGLTVCTASTVIGEEPLEEGQEPAEPREDKEAVFAFAGEFCPEETVKTIGVLDFARGEVAAKSNIRDHSALLSNWDGVPVCAVHNDEPGEGGYFDPNDPETWPVNDPDFDINDPNTWPEYPSELPAQEPGNTEPAPPPTEPDPGPGPTPESPPPEPPETAPPPEEEPYVPADGPGE